MTCVQKLALWLDYHLQSCQVSSSYSLVKLLNLVRMLGRSLRRELTQDFK